MTTPLSLFALYGNDDLKKEESLSSIIKKWLNSDAQDEMSKEVLYGKNLDDKFSFF